MLSSHWFDGLRTLLFEKGDLSAEGARRAEEISTITLSPKEMASASGGDNASQILRAFRENGVTHVVIGQLQADANLFSDPEKEFVHRSLRKIYQKNSRILYEVSPEAPDPETVSYEFLNHIGEAEVKMPGKPPGRDNTAYRVITDVDEDQRYALLTLPPAEVDFRLTLSERPVMKFAIGRKGAPCLSPGSFQLWVKSAEGESRKLFDREIQAPTPVHEVGWFEQELDLAAYAGQSITVTFKSELPGVPYCNWFLWADPEMISRR